MDMSIKNEEEAKNEVLKYFNNDQLAADVWWSKYRIDEDNVVETHPTEMFKRCSTILADKETDILYPAIQNLNTLDKWEKVSDMLSEKGYNYFSSFRQTSKSYMQNRLRGIYDGMINDFSTTVLGGSMYAGIGNINAFQSLSNCFVLGQPHDSYAGIIFKEHEMVQVEKRRGGCIEENTEVIIRGKGHTKIKNVKIGDFILSFNTTTKNDEWKEVKDWYYTDVPLDEQIDVLYENGTHLETSKKHPVLSMTEDGYKFVNFYSGELENSTNKSPNKSANIIDYSYDEKLSDIGCFDENNFNEILSRTKVKTIINDDKVQKKYIDIVVDGNENYYAGKFGFVNIHNCGTDLSTIRPEMAVVHNQSKYACGPILFLNRYSNATKEVSQNGRRGALMVSIRVAHPDAIQIINAKRDKTKITGANISIIISDEFMDCVFQEKDFIQRFPVTASIPKHIDVQSLEYNKKILDEKTGIILQRIVARDLWNEIVRANYECAEPGIMWEGTFVNYSTDGVYPQFKYVTSNPCFAGKTPVLTDKGYFQVADLNGQTVNVWNGEAWSAVTPKVTATNQEMLEVTLSDGTVFENTIYHKYPIKINNEVIMVEAKDLVPKMIIMPFNLPLVEGELHKPKSDMYKFGCKSEHIPLSNYSIQSRIDWLNGFVYEYGSIGTYGTSLNYLQFKVTTKKDKKILDDVKLLLTTLGIQTGITRYGVGGYKYTLMIMHSDLSSLIKFGLDVTKFGDRDYHKEVKDINGRVMNPDKLIYVEKIREIANADVVYCFNEPIHHKAVFNGILLGQCGEIGMGEYDACRLLALNLFSCVDKPFTKEATLNYDKLYDNAYHQMLMANSVIDLEVDYINNIINKIEKTSITPELMEFEKSIWVKILNVCQQGRRCGCGFLGLGDMLAALNLPYRSCAEVEQVMQTKMKAELDASIDLAIIHKPFDGWQHTLENNDMFDMIEHTFPEQYERMSKYGRRNVSWSTLAPTGSGGIIAQLTGGIEPLFMPFYKRRKKCMSVLDRVDYVDVDGEQFTEYFVIHPKLKMFCEITFGVYNWDLITEEKLKNMFEMSPYFENCAEDIPYSERIEMQSLIQKYTTHSISSTINLPKDTKVDTIDAIYREAYIKGLKGVTVYRDGSRGGIMVSDKNADKSDWFEEVKAPKRPDILDAYLHLIKYNNDNYCVIIGLLNDKPYECFVCYVSDMPKFVNPMRGQIVKRGADKYCFYSENLDINNIQNCDADTKIFGLMCSNMLRHRIPVKKIVKTFRKADMLITDFSNKILHVLAHYIPDGETDDYCEECWEQDRIKVKMTYQGGCCMCPNGHSKC